MIIVVGAGASGLVAAIEAAKRGHKVTVLERNEKPAKKIYATGNGKCNLTNTYMDDGCIRGTDDAFIKSVIDRFDYKQTMNYFKELGLMFKDRSGYIYPASGQASSVVESLLIKCYELDIKILCNVEVDEISKSNGRYSIDATKEGEKVSFSANGVILACGSSAGINKKKLANVTGYDLAKKLGHRIVPIVPSLTGIICKNKAFWKKTQGVRVDGRIEIINGEKSYDSVGELQLTEYGVSGIPTFQVCRYAAYGLLNKESVKVKLDLAYEISKEELKTALLDKKNKNPQIRLIQCFNGILNDKLSVAVIEKSGLDINKRGKELTQKDIDLLVMNIKKFKDDVTGINDIEKAQVCAGGVSLKEVTENMESIYGKNLYITGELLDADGICGGYNLQWAWATGYLAGNNILMNGDKK